MTLTQIQSGLFAKFDSDAGQTSGIAACCRFPIEQRAHVERAAAVCEFRPAVAPPILHIVLVGGALTAPAVAAPFGGSTS
jgi:hypothetical protein